MKNKKIELDKSINNLSDADFDKLDLEEIAKDAPVKLTEWENEPSVLDLKADLDASKPEHDRLVRRIENWREVTKAPSVKKVPGRSTVQPKLIRKQAEWRYSALSEPFLASSNLFSIKPRTFEDAKSARQNSLVINQQFDTKMDRVKFFDNYIRIGVDEGTVIVKCGWNRQSEKTKTQAPVWEYYELTTPEEQEQLMAAVADKLKDPRTFQEQSTEELNEAVNYFVENKKAVSAKIVRYEDVEVDNIIINQPDLDFVEPENFYFDPSCGGDLDRAAFVVESFETSKAELVKETGRYKNLDHVNWDSVGFAEHKTNTPDGFQFKDTIRKRIVAFEYWGFYDIHGTGELKPIVATWIGNTMIRLEENPFPDQKLPYIVESYMPVKRALFGEPDAVLLEDNQKILGAVTRGMVDLLGKSANSQQGVAKGFLDVVNRRRFNEGKDYEFNSNIHPQQGIAEHRYPEIPNSAAQMINLMNAESEALTGVKSFSGGLGGNAYGDVAAGIKGVLDAASKREMGILRRFANGVTKIGRKIISMNSEFLSDVEVVRITNEEFVEVNRDDLKGEFDLLVDISTAEVDNNKASDLAFMLQTIGNNMDFGVVQLILTQIAQLKRMPELAEQIKTFKPEPNPQLEEINKIEMQAKQAELEKTMAETRLIDAKAQQALALAGKAEIEAGSKEVEALKDIDGTAQKEALARHREQAQSNQDLKITDAILKPTKYGDQPTDVEAAIGWNTLSRELQKNEDTIN